MSETLPLNYVNLLDEELNEASLEYNECQPRA